ncbi:hypothetical protein SpAn4DRAFT_2575 [Sporomusa ovata]|uniref:Uncharacterized protein n=2 Tax=Sporomusa ovata TaxID=2378 RepID=A0A0U1L2F9_9FIRM|nr:hypothetical protein SpAn4DRAFT_2575 [Sporomusa ovata]
MIIQGEEVYKYWCSTVEEAVERAKELLNEDDPVYCICKKAENYYVFHSKKMKLSAHEIIETVTRQPESAEVNHEVIN